VRRRLLLSTGLIALVAVLVLGVPLGIVGTGLLRQRAVARLEREADSAAVVVGRRLRDHRPVNEAAVAELARPGHRLVVVLPGGARVAGGANVGREPLRAEAARAGALRVTALAPAVERTDGAGGVWLAVIVLSLLAVGTAVALALVQARRLAAPMERLARRAGRVADSGVSVDAHPTGIAEIDRIGAALADADRRVEEVLRREREFSDNASHQLRTPLAGLRMRLEELRALASSDAAADEADAAIAQADRLMDTIEHLEALARGRAAEPATADLAQVVAGHVVAAWAPRFAAAGRILTATPSDGVDARLAPETARQVVDVLLDNALRHGAGATAVTVTTDGRWARLRVADDGPGVAPARTAKLFERGWSSGNGGGGVGLAVARDLVRAEGGDLSLARARPACFELVVRAAAHDDRAPPATRSATP
jgi:signal transduction histidine kinase